MDEQFNEKIVKPEIGKPKKEKEAVRIIKDLCGGREGIYLGEDGKPVVFILQKGDGDEELYVLQFINGSKEALEELMGKVIKAGVDCRICWGPKKKEEKNGK